VFGGRGGVEERAHHRREPCVNGSAVSQALRKLEDRIGIALVQHTHTQPAPDARDRRYAKMGSALADVREAVAALGEPGAEPRGTLRLHVVPAAECLLVGDLLPGFLEEHPHVRLDLLVS
jgi:DNA-binding transcriptional LysR family regulator